MSDKANHAQTGAMSTTAPTSGPTAPRGVLVDLGPIAQLRAGRLARRLPQLYVGLFLYGVSLALMVRGALGLAPWDVLHSDFIRHVPMTLGQAVVLFSFVVLLLWIPLREMPGPSSYRLSLSLNSADGSRENKISMQGGGANMSGSSSAGFKFSELGSDGRDLNVVWNNFNGDERRYASTFAFKLRSKMNVGEKEIVPLVGLSADLKWQEIGTVELRRVK